MKKYLAKKMFNFVLVLFIATVCIFAMIKATGLNPVLATLGGGHLSEAALQERMQKYGLDKPLLVQFLYWLKNVLSGNFGESVKYKVAVSGLLQTYSIPTFITAFFSFFIAETVGIVLGIVSAEKRNTGIDHVISILTTMFLAVPVFFMGMLFILLISKTAISISYTGSLKTPGDYVERLFLPIIILALHQIALVTRVTRAAAIEQLNADYVLTLEAKGLSHRQIVWKHVLKNSLLPVITIAAVQFGSLIAGAVLVENIFSISGLGQLLVQAVLVGDVAVIQGVSLIVILVFQLANLLVDFVSGVLDPRIREKEVVA